MRHLFWAFIACVVPSFAFSFNVDIQKIHHGPKGQKFLIKYDFQGLELIKGPSFHGKSYHNIKLEGSFLHGKPGAPNIPTITKYIAIPKGSKVSTRVLNSQKIEVNNIRIAPAPEILNDMNIEPMRIQRDPKIYSYNGHYPQNTIDAAPKELRGVDVYQIAVTAGQHNPVQEVFSYYKELNIEIDIETRDDINDDQRLRSRWWDPIISDMISNPADLPALRPKIRSSKTNEDFEYLIITPPIDGFIKYAEKLKNWRNLQGIRTGIVTTQEIGGNNAESIKNYIHNAYRHWNLPPSAVLLIGDYGTDIKSIVSPLYNKYCLSDNIYADVTGDDLPDVIISRMTARNESELKIMVEKVINYENNPPLDPYYYDHPTIAMGWELERWFQIGAESINGFYTKILEKDPTLLYVHNKGATNKWSTAPNTEVVMDYFGIDGLNYIPETPDHLSDWDVDENDVNDAIDKGSFLVLHRDHGSEWGWGHPNYKTPAVRKLKNKNPTFILSINCLTGKYDAEDESFAEAIHRHPQGALGIIAASHASSSFVNDALVWGIFDYMWPNFLPELGKDPNAGANLMPAFANVAGKYFLQRSNWPQRDKTKAETYHLFHYHGDAFLRLFSEVPTQMQVKHKNSFRSGLNLFQVEVEDGAFAALTHNENIIATAESKNGVANLMLPNLFPGSKIVLTITKQNRFRYKKTIRVKHSTTPLVLLKSFEITGEPINGGTIQISPLFENVSLKTLKGVSAKITSSSPYVINPDRKTINLGKFGWRKSKQAEQSFKVTIDPTTPNRAQIPLEITLYNQHGNIVSVNPILFEVSAPELKFISIVKGLHNILPGSSRAITYSLINRGKFRARNVIIQIFKDGKEMGSVDVDSINAGETKEIHFIIPFELTDETSVTIKLEAKAENASQITFSHPITLNTSEDFELGNFLNMDWGFIDNPWIVTTQESYQGQFSARSANILHLANSTLVYRAKFPQGGTISFYKKVSCEKWDSFTFRIDDRDLGYWQGEIDWTYHQFEIPPGEHTLKWVFHKDYKGSEGLDAAFLDNITITGAQ